MRRAYVVRPATDNDLPALTAIYNHYIVNTPITFDVEPFSVDERRAWFREHARDGRYRMFVADTGTGEVVGYATTSRFRVKAAYDTTVEASVYCRADCIRTGAGTALYGALFDSLQEEDIHRIVAGVTLPNDASLALHARFGFREVGTLSAVGRKFERFWDVAWFERPLLIR